MRAYAYFDKAGNLLEFVSDTSVRQGNENVNEIYLYIEELTSDKTLHQTYKDAETSEEIIIPEVTIQNIVVNDGLGDKFPLIKKYDPKHFITGKTYPFVGFNIPAEVMNDDGGKLLTISIINNDETLNCQYITFYVENTAIHTTTINRAEYLYLIDYVNKHGGGTGYVYSVNGKTGVVNLNASDIKLSNSTTTLTQKFYSIDTDITQIRDSIPTISLSQQGSSTATVSYITLNGIQYKIVGEQSDLSEYRKAADQDVITNTFAKSLTMNSTTFVLTLKDADGNILSTVDLPLETMVVNASYDGVNKKIILTLKNGQTVDIPIGDLVSGLATEQYVNEGLSYKQATLVSGQNIKTINGNNILGTGNIQIEMTSDVNSVNGKTGTVVLKAEDIMVNNTQSIQDNLERIDEAVETNTDDIDDLKTGKLEASKQAVAGVGGLVTPTAVLSSNELVGVGVNGEQVRIQLGSGLTLSGSTSPYTLIANGGSEGTKLYRHSLTTDSKDLVIITNTNSPITITNLYYGNINLISVGESHGYPCLLSVETVNKMHISYLNDSGTMESRVITSIDDDYITLI